MEGMSGNNKHLTKMSLNDLFVLQRECKQFFILDLIVHTSAINCNLLHGADSFNLISTNKKLFIIIILNTILVKAITKGFQLSINKSRGEDMQSD